MNLDSYYNRNPTLFQELFSSNTWLSSSSGQGQSSTPLQNITQNFVNHNENYGSQDLFNFPPASYRPISPTHQDFKSNINQYTDPGYLISTKGPENLSLNSSGNTNFYEDSYTNSWNSSSDHNVNKTHEIGYPFPENSVRTTCQDQMIFKQDPFQYEQGNRIIPESPPSLDFDKENVQPLNFSKESSLASKFNEFLENYNSYKKQDNYQQFKIEEPNTTVQLPTGNIIEPDPVKPPRPHVCPYANCGKSYIKRGHLNDHMKIHSNIKTYHCTHQIPLPNDQIHIDDYGLMVTTKVCGESFLRCDELTRHKRTHFKEKPFRCPYCSKSFLRTDHRRAHIRRHPAEDRVDPDMEEELLQRCSLVKFTSRKRKERA